MEPLRFGGSGPRKRIKQHLRDVRFMVCRKCAYDLVEHGPEGTCPECGTDYTAADLEKHWRRRYGMLENVPQSSSIEDKPWRQ